MIDEEKIYFIDTPVEIQDEIYHKTIEYLNNINIDYNSHVYLFFSPVPDNNGKFYFKCHLKNQYISSKYLGDEPNFIIFYS